MGLEPRPWVMLSVDKTVLDATAGTPVGVDWFCCAVSIIVVYPPIDPLKVGEAVTKTIAILLGLDALDPTVTVDVELSTEAIEKGSSELGCELLGTAAIESPISDFDSVLPAVLRGGNGAVTCIVLSTVTILVVCEYTVATSGCVCWGSETAVGLAPESAKAGIGRICVDVDTGIGAAAAPVPSCLL